MDFSSVSRFMKLLYLACAGTYLIGALFLSEFRLNQNLFGLFSEVMGFIRGMCPVCKNRASPMHYNCNKILQQKIHRKNYKENSIHKKLACTVETGIFLSPS